MKLDLIQLTAAHPSAKGVAAVRHIHLSVAAGEHVAIIGPSGAGKTTLLHAMGLAIRPISGELQHNDANPWALSRSALQHQRGQLLLAPQVPPLPPRQRVVTAVTAALLPQMGWWDTLASLFYARHAAAAHAALQPFDLGDKLYHRVDRLSGGERQRVGLARCVASQASLLLVDEPLSALDPVRSEQALVALKATAREKAATLVVSLHQVHLALAHFPRIVALRAGELVFDLPSSQVTPELLNTVYGDQAHELNETPLAAFELPVVAAQPVVMHCR